MPVSHYRVLKDKLKYNGRVYNLGDPISRDAILEADPAGGKVGTLLRTRMIEEAPTGNGETKLEDWNMDDLRDHARDLGVTGPLGRSKADVIEKIEEAKHGS